MDPVHLRCLLDGHTRHLGPIAATPRRPCFGWSRGNRARMDASSGLERRAGLHMDVATRTTRPVGSSSHSHRRRGRFLRCPRGTPSSPWWMGPGAARISCTMCGAATCVGPAWSKRNVSPSPRPPGRSVPRRPAATCRLDRAVLALSWRGQGFAAMAGGVVRPAPGAVMRRVGQAACPWCTGGPADRHQLYWVYPGLTDAHECMHPADALRSVLAWPALPVLAHEAAVIRFPARVRASVLAWQYGRMREFAIAPPAPADATPCAAGSCPARRAPISTSLAMLCGVACHVVPCSRCLHS